MSWGAEEFATVELGDKRLNKRLVKLVAATGGQANGEHSGRVWRLG